ncbi:hypothetical protein [Variovorax paradoxus]|uniref:hypothetical protein n=1 Tax=Variovorax paradoxus TaxID=34073 RepID=UPI002481149F|nr:hypothetical protein [Variovorax paradoxus]WGT63741.1 hypothetical protein QHG62_27585 [Variovorax paradoxus]
MFISKFIVLLACFLFLDASAAGSQFNARPETQKHTDCLDKLCPREITPKTGPSEVALKLNGHWFIGPRKYFSSVRSAASFEWWDHKALDPSEKRPSDAQLLALDGKGYDLSVEIFLRSNRKPPSSHGMYDLLIDAEKESRVLSKTTLRSGLEVWRVQDQINGVAPGLWYVATQVKDDNGLPPVVYCRDSNPKFDRCTMGFMWQKDIYADIRFRGKHGSDWPEIYKEIFRILQLMKRA